MSALETIIASGFALRLDGDRLLISPLSKVDADLRAYVEAHRSEIITELTPACHWRVTTTDKVLCYHAPSGATHSEVMDWAARDYGSVVACEPVIIEPAPEPQNVNAAIAEACAGVIDPEVFRSLLTAEDITDIQAGRVSVGHLRCAAASIARR